MPATVLIIPWFSLLTFNLLMIKQCLFLAILLKNNFVWSYIEFLLVYLILCQHSLLVRRRQTSGFIEYFVWIRFFFFHCNFFTIPALSKKGLAWATKKSAFLIGWSQFGQHNLLFHIVHNMPIVLILLLSLAWLSMACCWMQNLATAKYVSRCKIKIPELSYLVTGTRSGRWFLPLLPQISN